MVKNNLKLTTTNYERLSPLGLIRRLPSGRRAGLVVVEEPTFTGACSAEGRKYLMARSARSSVLVMPNAGCVSC